MKKIRSLKRYDCTDEGQDQLIYEVVYNDKEQPLVEIEYNQSGYPISKNTHEYDEKGKLLLSILEGEEPEATQQIKYTYLDEDKHLIKETIYADGSSQKEETKLSDNQQIARRFDFDGELSEETNEIFDKEGKIEKLVYKNLEFDQEEEHIYTYDEKQQLIKKQIIVEGEEDRATHWTYDEQGRITLEETLDPDDEVLNRHYYTYDGDNLLEEGIEEYESYDNQLRLRFGYDDKGHLVQQIQETYAGDLIQETAYELNDNGHIEVASYVRTGLYVILYGGGDNEYTKTIRNEIEYFNSEE